MIEQIVPGQTLGAQLIKGVWSVWLRSIRAKCYLAETIRDLEIGGVKISMYDTYPVSKPIPNEKVSRSPSHVVCNYYKCNLKVFDMRFQSVEYAYQWRFMKCIGMDEHALDILDAQTPNEAKFPLESPNTNTKTGIVLS